MPIIFPAQAEPDTPDEGPAADGRGQGSGVEGGHGTDVQAMEMGMEMEATAPEINLFGTPTQAVWTGALAARRMQETQAIRAVDCSQDEPREAAPATQAASEPATHEASDEVRSMLTAAGGRAKGKDEG
jgi:hypothetical protein